MIIIHMISITWWLWSCVQDSFSTAVILLLLHTAANYFNPTATLLILLLQVNFSAAWEHTAATLYIFVLLALLDITAAVFIDLEMVLYTHGWLVHTHKKILVYVLKRLKTRIWFLLKNWLRRRLFISYLRLKWGLRRRLLISLSIFSLLIGDLLGYMVYDWDLIYLVFIGKGVDGRRPS